MRLLAIVFALSVPMKYEVIKNGIKRKLSNPIHFSAEHSFSSISA